MFLDNPLIIQLIAYLSIILFFWFLELLLFPQAIKEKGLHSFVNLKFIAFVLPVQLLLSTLVFYVAGWTVSNEWGVLHLLPITENKITYFLVAFLAIDFFDYFYHVLMHKVPFLWRFHQVHHSDMDVDISTTIREHPGETFVRVSYLVAVVFILGVPGEFLLLKQFIQSFVNLTSHSKVKLPKKVNDIVSLVFVTPNTHHVHHHYVLPHTDSNFGDILTIWDHLFKTFSNLNQSEIVHGVDTNMNADQNKDFKDLIKRPFDNNRVHTTNPKHVNEKPTEQPLLKVIR